MADKNFRVRHGLEVDGNATLSGDLQVDGNDIKGNGGTTAITLSGADVAVAGDLTVTGNDIKGSGGTTAITMNAGSVTVANDLTITGNTIDLAQNTTIEYDENNNRINRPTVISTTGNSSGFRVAAPNATTSAQASLSSFNTNDPNNGKFINLTARGSTTNPLRLWTGAYTAGVLGASGNQIDIVDGTTIYATINPAGVVNNTDLATKLYVDSNDDNTTYTIDASTATGGANFNLVGSDSTTDTVKFSGSGGTTVTRTSANEITISSTAGVTYNIDASTATGGANLNLTGSDSSTDTVKFSGSGATTVTQTNANEITISSTDNNTTYTIDASSTTGGANLNLVGSDLTTDTVKFASGTGVTVSQTSANEMSIAIGQAVGTGDNPVFAGVTGGNISVGVSTDNTIASTNTNGNINITPNGTGVVVIPTADVTSLEVTNIRALDGTAAASIANTTGVVTVSTELNVDNININGNTISSTNANGDILITPNGTGDVDLVADTVQIGDANATATLTTNGTGNLVLNTNNGTNAGSITLAQGTNGNITVTPNGTGVVIFDSVTRLRGESQATTNNNYTFPPSTLTTVTDNNGYSAVSSFANVTGNNGYQANAQYIQYTADTRAAANSVPNLTFRQANGNSVAGVNIPWTGVNSVAASASLNGDVLGSQNFNGYATTGFTQDVATQGQGGGIGTTHVIQIQSYAAENLADGTKTLTSADITAVASSVRSALVNPQITGTRGQISFNATTVGVGQAIRVTGTLTGTGTGIVSGNNYWVIETNGTTTATLSDTPNGYPITTTAGTLTGLTLTRCLVTFTIANQTSYPFGRNALVTVSNVNNVANGTYPVAGLVNSLTSITLGIPHTVAPTLPGTQQFTCPTVTNGGGGYRIRAVPLATPMNPANRLLLVDHTAASATYRADAFTWATGAYGGTGSTTATLDNLGNLAITGDLRVNGNDIRSSDNTSQIITSAAGATLALRGNAINLQNAAGAALTSAGIGYTRTYGEFAYTNAAGFAIAAQNTIYAMPLDTTLNASGTSTSNTSRINIAVSGWYKIIISLQATLTVSNQPGQFDFWLRKNGNDVANSKTQVDLLKDQKSVISMDWLVNSNGTDYWEIVYVGTTTNYANINFPTIAATTTPYVSPVAPALLVNVIPAGM